MAGKKGGSIMAGLWTGTAFYAASHAKTFGGFISSFIMYALVIVVSIAVLMWVLAQIGLIPREKFSVAEIPCPQGSSAETRNGERVCVTPTGTVTVMPA